MSRTATIIVAAVTLAFVGSTQSYASRPSSPESDVVAVGQAWAAAWSAKQLDAAIDLYAADAAFFPSIGGRIAGREAIHDLFARALASNSPTIHMRSTRVAISGDLAYDSGEYDESLVSDGHTTDVRGNYLIVLRRESDRWRIVEHMWTDVRPAG